MTGNCVDENPLLMYEKCVTCNRLGKSCFPNFYQASAKNMREWSKRRMKYLGWSYAVLAQKSGVPAGTISYTLSKKDADVYYSTFAPVLCALVGGDEGESACPEDTGNPTREREQLELLQRENESLKEQLLKSEEIRRNAIQATKDADQSMISYLKNQVKNLITALICATCVSVFLVFLDRMDPDFGLFWRDGVDLTPEASIVAIILFLTISVAVSSCVSLLVYQHKQGKKK